MAFQLVGQEDVVKGNLLYTVSLYFDPDTNTQKHEYVRDGEVLYYLEYEVFPSEEPDRDLDITAIVAGFNQWFDQFGPDWQPQAFYLNE